MLNIKKYTLICGHYGCGKTNFSLNLALDLAAAGEKVTVVDMDIVNPYFRSSDYDSLLESRGIRLIAPRYSRSTLDIPSLPAEIASTFEDDGGYVIVDVGGDDAGATALGRFASAINAFDHDMLYVINKYRPLTEDAPDAAALLGEIEAASRIKATGIVNNSHLMMYTTAQTVRDSLSFADETAAALGLEIRCTTAPRDRVGELTDVKNIYPVDVYVKTPWM